MDFILEMLNVNDDDDMYQVVSNVCHLNTLQCSMFITTLPINFYLLTYIYNISIKSWIFILKASYGKIKRLGLIKDKQNKKPEGAWCIHTTT